MTDEQKPIECAKQNANPPKEDPTAEGVGMAWEISALRQANERLRAEKTAATETVVSLSAACDRLREKLTTAKAQELNWSNQLKGEIETRKEWQAASDKADKRIAELEKYLNACAFGDVRVVKESGGFSYVLLSQPSTYTYDSIEEAIAAALLKEKP